MAENNTDKQEKPKKIKKAKGPIRWGAVVPFTILVCLMLIYFKLFFDAHLRKGMEWVAGKAVGAEVDIADVDTSFLSAHISIKGIEMTDSEKPERNSISIGDIRFGMSWDALLRAKVLVNEAVIEQIEFAKPRKKAGWVAPPEPPPVDDGKPSKAMEEANKVKDIAADKLAKENADNVFGDIAAVMKGGSGGDQMGKLEASLASKPMAASLQTKVNSKQTEWNERLKKLPQGSEFQALGDRLSKVKTKDFKTPQELQQSLQELDTIFKEADAKIKTVQAAGTDLDKDLKDLQDQARALEAQIKTDLKTLQTHFKIPQIDAKTLTLAIFKKYLDPYLSKFQTYRNLAEKYVPPNLMKKGQKEPDPAIQAHPRSSGVTYEFGRQNSYPMFWIKRTAVSSQAGSSPYSGNIKGEILDISTNQVLTGKPTIVNVAGDFPSAGINGFSTKLSIDNRKELSVIDLATAIKSYAVEGRDFVSGGDVQIGIKKGTGALDMSAKLVGLKDLNMKVDNNFSQLDYVVSATDGTLDQMLKSIFKGIPVVTVDGRLEGTFPRINLGVDSNLGPELQKGFSREIDAKIAEAKAKIDKYIQDEVGKTKAQIDGEIAKLKGQVDGEIKKLQAQADVQKKKAEAQADAAKKDAENRLNAEKKKAEDQAKAGLQKEAEKAAEDLKKKLGW